ncbi:chitin binding peritrophin-A domain-containing protein [Nocardia wallacei]|uniref:chitin binding peritrophin-A domain-containing protein n=1 Tax=Nocardia wallacei TaxID=480035 RepID=UPI003CC7E4E2
MPLQPRFRSRRQRRSRSGPNSDGLAPDPQDATAFYVCTHWTASHKRCPRGLLYDMRLQLCNYSAEVPLNGRPDPDE